jgi:hypothetical protein
MDLIQGSTACKGYCDIATIFECSPGEIMTSDEINHLGIPAPSNIILYFTFIRVTRDSDPERIVRVYYEALDRLHFWFRETSPII